MKILCLGDSLTYGYGIFPYDEKKAWPYLLGKYGGYRVVNGGIPGDALLANGGYWNSSHYLAMMRKKPDAVIFWLGANDSSEDPFDEKKFERGYEIMVEDLLEHVVRQHLLLIEPLLLKPGVQRSVYDFGIRKEPIEKIRRIVKDCAKRFDVESFDAGEKLKMHPECYSDDVHPDSEGNILIAETLLEKVQSMGWK